MQSWNEQLDEGGLTLDAQALERARDRAFAPALAYLERLQYDPCVQLRRSWNSKERRRNEENIDAV